MKASQPYRKTMTLARRKAGVSGEELLRRLRSVRFNDAERKELVRAMEQGAKTLSDYRQS